MGRILSKKAGKEKKALNLKFYIDCSAPVEDKVLLLNEFQDFLKKRVKYNGKTGNLGSEISISTEESKILVQSQVPFSKRYLKYLTKKYLKQNALRNYLFVNASDKNTYVLRYFNIQQGSED
jgi:large subunit ribosomal protein L22e